MYISLSCVISELKKKEIKRKRENLVAPRYGGRGSYCRQKGEHRQRQGHLGEPRVDMSRLKWAMWEREKRWKEKGREGMDQNV